MVAERTRRARNAHALMGHLVDCDAQSSDLRLGEMAEFGNRFRACVSRLSSGFGQGVVDLVLLGEV